MHSSMQQSTAQKLMYKSHVAVRRKSGKVILLSSSESNFCVKVLRFVSYLLITLYLK